MTKCDCNTFYLFTGKPLCLHRLFASGLVKIVVKEKTSYGRIRFYIYRDKPKEKSQAWKRQWWRSGLRAQLTKRDQILLAINLSKKYQVKRVVV